MNNSQTNQRTFGLRDRIAYMTGDIANDLSFIMSAYFLMLFYTNVLEIEGYIVGLLFLGCRVIDAFTDVGMGRIVDTIKPFPEGRFRGLIRRAAPFVCVMGFLMFLHVVKDFPYGLKLAYVIITYIAWGSLAYTAVNIPYGSMATVITSKADERASLSVFRSLGANIAVLIIQFAVPLLIYTQIDGKQTIVPEMFTIIMAVFMVIAFFLYQFCWRNSVERVQIEPQAKRNQEPCINELKVIVKGLLTNKPLMIFILVAILLLLANLLIGTMNPYLYIDYFNSKQALSIAGLIGVVTMFAVAPFAEKTVKRFGKKESAAVALLIATIFFGFLFFIKTTNEWLFLALTFMGMLGLNYFMVIIWSFIADIIDAQYLKTGRREDGTIYAVYSFARKIGQALAGGLGGFALTAVGYVAKAPVQSEQTLSQIYGVATLVPTVACLAVFLILQFWYPLSKQVVDANAQTLESRK